MVETREIEKLRGKKRGEVKGMRRDGDDRAVRSIPHSMYEVQYRREIKSAVLLLCITYIYAYYTLYRAQYTVE